MPDKVLGCDVGFGAVKAVGANGHGNLATTIFLKALANADTHRDMGKTRFQMGVSDDVYTINDRAYFIGHPALLHSKRLVNANTRDFIRSEAHCALVCKTVTDLGFFADERSSIDLDYLVLGVPPGMYTKQVAGELISQFKQGVTFARNGREYRFRPARTTIVPQGIGAFYEHILADNGAVRESSYKNKNIGIVDIGYRTTDLVLFKESRYMADLVHTEDTGLGSDTGPIGLLRQYIHETYGRLIEQADLLKDIFEKRCFLHEGEQIDISTICIELVVRHFRKYIEPTVLATWDQELHGLSPIIVCGGGALYLQHVPEFLQRFAKNILIPDDPAMANARGYYRYAQLLLQRERYQATNAREKP